jgi:transposase
MIMNMQDLAERLDRIESSLQQLAVQRLIKEYYSTSEIARLVKRSEFTVREWCRLGRIAAEKRACGRGRSQEWMIPHDELLRFQCEGLLPIEH